MSQITKRALASSLKELMEEKPLSKITVKDVAERCGVNRHTFYYHFKDMYDLIEWIYTVETEKLVGGITYDTWQEGARRMFVYAQENRRFILNTYRSLSKEYLLKYFTHRAFEFVSAVVEELTSSMEVSQEKKDFVSNFYSYAFVGVFVMWIENGMEEEPEHILALLFPMFQEDIHRALERLVIN